MFAKPTSRLAVLAAVLAATASPAFAQERAGIPDFGERLGQLAVALGFAVVALFLSLWLAMKAVEMAIRTFDRVTDGMNEWEELRKGNVAVGILMAAVIYAVGNVISGSVSVLTVALMHPSFQLEFVVRVVVAVVNFAIGLWIATYVVGLALRTLDRVTKNLEEMKEIAKGNVAVAVLVAGALLAVSQVVTVGIEGVSRIASVESVAGVVGIEMQK
jgi:uncharacterized membrane protein YjfL (UPF0719 family)